MKNRLLFLLPIIGLIFGRSYAESDYIAELRTKAEKGDAAAQYRLGFQYAIGDRVTQNEVEAVRWFRRAAEQGDASAQYNLGVCYYSGKGVIKDEAEAVKWFRKAAEQGDASAQYNLGVCYANGKGVSRDFAQGHAWCSLASVGGSEMGKKASKLIDSQMTPEQKAEAAKLARELEAMIKSAKDKKK